MRSAIALTVLLAAGLPVQPYSAAAEPNPEEIDFFEKRIRPVLANHCQECHGEDAQESDLRLDSLAGLLRGGTRGPAIVVGKPSESLLVRAVGHGETLQMPPKRKLPGAEIADLAQWIKLGAPWPNTDLPADASRASSKPATPMEFSAKQLSHWAFQPVVRSPLPITAGAWAESPIDLFIQSKLEGAGLTSSPAADRRTLLRRAFFDLTGLPPAPEDIEAFIADGSPDAFPRVVDRLLASPRYGEKYGRHWLDLARYGDSNGLDENLAYANAFRYRDYVIAAFNKDKPYDRFVQEQIAGDLLPHTGLAEELEGIVATGFLSLGAKMLAEDDPVKMQMDIIDEQIDTLGKAFLGLTLGCARCHNHKYDPVDQLDYYALAGILKSTKTMENHKVVAVWQERPLADRETIARRDELQRQADAQRSAAKSVANRATEELLSLERKRAGDYLWAAHVRQRRAERLSKTGPLGDKPPQELAAIDGLQIVEAEDFARGNVIKDTTKWGLGIGVLVNRGELPNYAEYDLEIERAGTYRLELRYAAEASRPCKVLVGGKPVLDKAAGQVTGSWLPQGQKWFVEGLIDLPKGGVTIRLEQPQFFPHIDKLLITPADPSLADAVAERQVAADLKEPFLSQWQQALKKSQADRQSIFAPWHNLATESAGDKAAEEKLAQRLDLASVRSPRDLAERYGELFAAAEAAWLAVPKRADGEGAAGLDDPVLEAARQVLYGDSGPFAVPKRIEELFSEYIVEKLKRLRDAAAEIEKALPIVAETMAVSDADVEDVRIHFRGSHLTLGEPVPRRFLRIMAGGDQPAIGNDRSGRLELAQWLTRPQHPLTARVIVNRLWQWHFGRGLVESSENFGLLGETPSHGELLDTLAARFVEDGWSLKRMHRSIMVSATYRQSGKPSGGSIAWDADPENRLLSCFPRRRLTAEEIRDSILHVAGRLDLKMGGSYLPTANRQYVTSTANVNPEIYDLRCRSVYVPVVRSALYDVFQAFDFADPSVLVARRDSTTVAPQALFMLNSRLTAEASRALADELLARPDLDDPARVQWLYNRCYGRPANESDIRRAIEFLDRYSQAAAGSKSAEPGRPKAWQALCRSVLAASEFVYVE